MRIGSVLRHVALALAALAITEFAVARTASAAWPSLGRALCTAPGDQLGPSIASDGAGGAIVVWHDRRSFPFNIDVQHVLASGEADPSWPANGRALLPDALVQSIVPQGVEFPTLVPDGAGGAIVTWPDARSGISGLDVFAHHVLASGVVDPTWPVNGAIVCSAPGAQGAPVIISDGAGGAFIAWTDSRAGGATDVFAQHLLASGVVDPIWPANGVAVSTAPKAQTSQALVADGIGGIIVTWSDARSGNPGMDIYAQHVSSAGVVDPAWAVNGRPLSAAPGTQSLPRIISDGVPTAGGSGAIVTWTDDRDGNNHIYAQRVLASGAIASGWAIDGQVVSVSGTDEVAPTLVSDGGTGAIVAWGDATSGHHNIRARHLLASGALDPTWPVGGARLGIAGSEETFQVMASDGAGGAIVAWQQNSDIFAQHVLASGALDSAYPAGGRAVVALPNQQHEPEIIATGAGGAIVTWEDTRDGPINAGQGFNDIYALQVLEAGTVSVPPQGPPVVVSLARPSPNPAREAITLRFILARDAFVRLTVYDLTGRTVRTLASGNWTAGEHELGWNLRDESGRAVDAGLYLARLEVEGRSAVQRFTTLR